MSPEDDAKVAARLAKLQANVTAAEEYLAEKQRVFERSHVEHREVGEIQNARMLLGVARNSLTRAKGNLQELLDKVDEEEERLEMRKPPDLQQLVLDHGTYDKITPEAWDKFDKAMAEWKAKIRFGEFPPKRI